MVVNLNTNIRFYPVIFGNAKVDRFFLTTKINANYFKGSFYLLFDEGRMARGRGSEGENKATWRLGEELIPAP